MRQSTRRIVLIVVGVFVLTASVMGFYLAADVFDERSPVLVSTRHIAAGETLSSADLGSALLVLSESTPHIPWTPEVHFAFNGTVAVQPIPQGALLRHDMVMLESQAPVGVQLEMVVPLDTSLASGGVFEGDLVLLIDPGADPVGAEPGRPRKAVGQASLSHFDGSLMRLFLTPEEWAEWEALLDRVGTTLMVLPVPLGGDTDEMTLRLNAVWHEQWAAAPRPGPGELEVVVPLDTTLAPSGVFEGDLVLLIDPGADPVGTDPGRPRSVRGTTELENYADGKMRRFEPPEDWLWWSALPERLGAAPMVLPVPAGSDIEDLTKRLDKEWNAAWDYKRVGPGATKGTSK